MKPLRAIKSTGVSFGLVAELLYVACLVFTCGCGQKTEVVPKAGPTQAQQNDPLHKQFLGYKAKAEQGDAEAQYKLGSSYDYAQSPSRRDTGGD